MSTERQRLRRIAKARAFLAEELPEQLTLANLVGALGSARNHIEMLLEELEGDR